MSDTADTPPWDETPQDTAPTGLALDALNRARQLAAAHSNSARPGRLDPADRIGTPARIILGRLTDRPGPPPEHIGPPPVAVAPVPLDGE